MTNDIYTKEDANFLINKMVLKKGRIIGVETGGCPHTAIREDCSLNKNAVFPEPTGPATPTLNLLLIN